MFTTWGHSPPLTTNPEPDGISYILLSSRRKYTLATTNTVKIQGAFNFKPDKGHIEKHIHGILTNNER